MKSFFIRLLVCVLCSVPVCADEKALQAFSQTLLAVDTMTGHFTQRIIAAGGEDEYVQTTEGKFIIKRPGYFLWHVSPPYEQLLIGTPGSLKVYDPDLEQMTVHAQDSLAGTPASLISGDVASISQNYAVEREQNKETETYLLRHKSADEGAFESLSFVFSRTSKTKLLLEMSFTDRLGQKVEIIVSKQKNNPKVSVQAFEFEPPKGTDIIIDG